MEWHYSFDGAQIGPVKESELPALILAGRIGPQTPVWRAGMPDWSAAANLPELAEMLRMSPAVRSTPPIVADGIRPMPEAASQGDATGGVIPYKNPMALTAYYLGIGTLIPCVGPLLAVGSIILGILGLRARARNPSIRGSIHAWIGIVLGVLSTIVQLAVFILIMSR